MQVFTVGQKLSFEHQGFNYLLTVLEAASSLKPNRGLFTRQTQIVFESAGGSSIKVSLKCLKLALITDASVTKTTLPECQLPLTNRRSV